VFAQVAQHPLVTLASPVLEVQSLTIAGERRLPLRVVGVDALVLPTIAPALMPRTAEGGDRLALLAPGHVSQRRRAQALGESATTVQLRVGTQWQTLSVAGQVAAGGAALAVMDIGAAQDLFERGGQLTRIDLRLAPGADRAAFIRSLRQAPGWPAGIQIAEPGDAAQRVSNLSRAYRVNLTVLALVALFTGAFLVFSVLARVASARSSSRCWACSVCPAPAAATGAGRIHRARTDRQRCQPRWALRWRSLRCKC
jgi:putative ABC transport system permease protein